MNLANLEWRWWTGWIAKSILLFCWWSSFFNDGCQYLLPFHIPFLYCSSGWQVSIGKKTSLGQWTLESDVAELSIVLKVFLACLYGKWCWEFRTADKKFLKPNLLAKKFCELDFQKKNSSAYFIFSLSSLSPSSFEFQETFNEVTLGYLFVLSMELRCDSNSWVVYIGFLVNFIQKLFLPFPNFWNISFRGVTKKHPSIFNLFLKYNFPAPMIPEFR